jgi:FG-GAP-like repeat/PASTA domain/FG-GAP repeat
VKKLVAFTCVLVLGGSLGVGALFASSAPSFAAARSYPTGRLPSSIAIGDLNGDDLPDLATANAGNEERPGNTVSVLQNRGDGTFRAKRDYRTGAFPGSVGIGDLNGDSKPDLVAANDFDNSVSVLLNRGDGGFQPKIDYETGRRPFSVAIGDLNGDGERDLATANVGVSTVSVLLNRGDGSFQPKVDYPTGKGLGSSSVAIGDLNGDGELDLATANYNANSVSVLMNRGDGSFHAGRDYRTGSLTYSVAIGDLNADGQPDLATANPDASDVSVLLNTGDGTFGPRHNYATGRNPFSVAIGELNGDGKPDLATVNTGEEVGTVSVVNNRGNGSFQAKLDYRTGGGAFAVAIGDLNSDGKPDLATANSNPSAVSVLLNRPGLCTVQDVKRQKVLAAKRTIARANCRVGKIRRAYSKTVRGHVISQKPKPGTVLADRGKVKLVVSRGRKPS